MIRLPAALLASVFALAPNLAFGAASTGPIHVGQLLKQEGFTHVTKVRQSGNMVFATAKQDGQTVHIKVDAHGTIMPADN